MNPSNPQIAQQQAQNYLRTKVFTATPEQLQMMLFEGALRFGEQARVALEKRDLESSFNNITKVQKILVEMTSTLKHDVAPDLCSKLNALYNYAYRKLVEANVHHDIVALEEAMGMLKYQRETWAMLLDQIGKQKAAAAATQMNIPAPSKRMEAMISVKG